MRAVLNGGLILGLVLGLVVYLASSPCQATPGDRAEIEKTAQQFLTLYRQAKNEAELIPQIKGYNLKDYILARAITDFKKPLPPIAWDSAALTYTIDTIKLTVISAHEFKLNGKLFKVDGRTTLKSYLEAVKAVKFSWIKPLKPFWLVDEAEAAGSGDMFDWYRNPSVSGPADKIVSSGLTGGGPVALGKLGLVESTMTGFGTGLFVVQLMWWAAKHASIGLAMLTAPDCATQKRELTSYLAKNDLALKAIDCSPDVLGERYTDRFVSLWTGGKDSRSFYFDPEAAIAWEQNRAAYLFDHSTYKLQSVHRMNPNPNPVGGGSQLQRQDVNPGMPEFEDERKGITGFHGVFYYLSHNMSCYTCEKTLQDLVSPAAPDSLKDKSHFTVPSISQ